MDSKAILDTLLYADIFDYPLRRCELWQYLITKTPVSQSLFEKSLQRLLSEKKIIKKKSYYFLPERATIISLCKKREKTSVKKLQLAQKTVRILSVIPTVELIGISGGAARYNADDADDIDLFIIAKHGALWTTRALVLIFLSVLGRRRKNTKNVSNMFCVNMLLDEKVLEIKAHDLYTAHEVAQMKPLCNKNNTYEKFLLANKWVSKFLPNSLDTSIQIDKDVSKSEPQTIFRMLEYMARRLQFFYMRKKITRETISDTLLAFHPRDYKGDILQLYRQRQKKYATL